MEDGDGAAVGIADDFLVGRGVGLLVGVSESALLGVFESFEESEGEGDNDCSALGLAAGLIVGENVTEGKED